MNLFPCSRKKETMRPFVSLDPSTTATGWCVWREGRPVEWGVWKPPSKDGLWARIRFMLQEFGDMIYAETPGGIEVKFFTVATEDPQVYSIGRAATTQRALSLVVGALFGSCHPSIQWHPYHQSSVKASARPSPEHKSPKSKADAHEALAELSRVNGWSIPSNLSGDAKDAILVGWHHMKAEQAAIDSPAQLI